MNTARAVDLLLRFGVAFALLFPSLNAFLDPYAWIGYFPPLLLSIVPDMVALHVFGVVEIVLGLWILSGKHIYIPSLAAVVVLFVIVLFNLNEFQTLFRDVPIALSALALTLAHRPHTAHT